MAWLALSPRVWNRQQAMQVMAPALPPHHLTDKAAQKATRDSPTALHLLSPQLD